MSNQLDKMFLEIQKQKSKLPAGRAIENCTACAGEGDIEISEGEWECCLNCSGLGYTYVTPTPKPPQDMKYEVQYIDWSDAEGNAGTSFAIILNASSRVEAEEEWSSYEHN